MRTSSLLLAAALVLASSCVTVSTPPSASANLVASSAYIFRGVPQVDGAVMQGDMGFSVTDDQGGTWSMTTWANLNLSSDSGDAVFPDDRGQKITEIDITPEYSREFKGWSGALGFVLYALPNGVGTGTTEVYASAELDVLLHPALIVYYDLEEVEGLYATVGVSHHLELGTFTALEGELLVGFADSDQGTAYWGDDSSGLADLNAGVAVVHEWGEHVSVTAGVHASTILNGDYEDALDAADIDSNHITFLAGVGWSY